MAFTSSDLAKLEAAYASGVLEITSASGKKLKYNSMSDLWDAIQRLRNELRSPSKRHIGGVFAWKRNA